MIPDLIDLTGKKFRTVFSFTTRTVFISDIKYFIHSRMKRGCFKNLADLINQVEYNFVDVGM